MSRLVQRIIDTPSQAMSHPDGLQGQVSYVEQLLSTHNQPANRVRNSRCDLPLRTEPGLDSSADEGQCDSRFKSKRSFLYVPTPYGTWWQGPEEGRPVVM